MKKRIVRDFLILFAILIAVLIYFVYNPIVDSEQVKVISYKAKETELKDKLIDLLKFVNVKDGKTPVLLALNDLKNLVQDSAVSYELYYSNSDEVNAYALPSNMIVINRGLILKTESPEEIAGVIAHELGHLKNNHISEKMLTSLTITVLLSNNSTPAEVTKVLAENMFSRDMEVEADDYAIKKLNEIGISPYYVAKLFKTLYTSTSQIPEFLSTHPGMNERITKFSKYKNDTSSAKFSFDWGAVKSSL